jgi:tetratricopeptide (TPR) repeat protein
LLFYYKGDFTSAKEHFEEGIVYCEEAKWTWGAAMALGLLGYVDSMLGDPETGRKKTEKGLYIWAETGVVQALSFGYYIMGEISLALHDLQKAQNSMEEALNLSRKNREKMNEGLALVGLGRVLAKKEPRETEEAEESFREGLTILHDLQTKPNYSQGIMFLGEFYLDRSQKEKALENQRKAEALFREMGMDYWLAKAQEALAKL